MVVLDTNIFKGIPPRNWGKTFRNFISKHLIGKKFLTFDENGKEEIIEFAKPNERVTKNGANNSHKVIDKLSRKSDRNSKLVIVHSDEVINISEKENENAEHSHQWLDENGWEFRNAFVMDKYGKIYSVTLNIAKSKDGRNILYDINKINEVGYGDVLSNAKGKRSSHINPNFVTNSISQSENNVNTKNDESSNDIKYSMGGLKAETADKSALEKAMELEKDGTDSEKIRKETGWFKGYDGKWRFEIDNSELKFKTDIEKNRAAAIELAKMKVKSAELEEKIVNNTATKAEENEYYNLDEKMIEYRKGVKLSDVINHPKLFEAYPQLKNVDVYYEISSVNRGVYSSNGNVIMLNPMHTIDEQKEAIIHEIQHAIQGIENFANGSNLEYWKNLGYSDEEAMAMY
ncbi:LPD23 domain-containing protein, partial [Ruminococcus sp.]|uniref:LPD23 domain-containing protein n=1 Tax=Ruminococcus sp. TaxID=41978 RepID=UPI003AEFB7B6